MRDFTFQALQLLLENLKKQGYCGITFQEYLNSKESTNTQKWIILRHDVEEHYKHALHFAKIEHQLGYKGSFFFRILPKSFKPEIVKQIADLGHEVGYHYDDLTECHGDYEKAIARFQKNLNTLRAIAPVKTICMDGSPLSKYDNKNLWKKDREKRSQGDGKLVRQEDIIDNENTSPSPSVSQSLQSQKSFQDFGIIGEPYFNIDFNKVFYLTDTGRRWDGWKTSVRDKVPQQGEWVKQGLIFKTTQDIINAAHQGKLPPKIMFTFHPQRWTDNPFLWTKELVLQNVKNQVKMFLVKK